MRLTGALTLSLDGPPRLSLYASRAYGGFLALDIYETLGGARSPGAEVTLFVPPACGPALRRAVEAFNAAMAQEGDRDGAGASTIASNAQAEDHARGLTR